MEFADGTNEIIAANIIAENILSQVDEEGHTQLLLSEIIDHRTNGSEVQESDAFIMTRSGGKRRVRTTKGWELRVFWKDGSTCWIKLKDLKNSFPIELAKYAVSNNISTMPAFAWWVPFVLKKKDRIISKLKTKYWLRTHINTVSRYQRL